MRELLPAIAILTLAASLHAQCATQIQPNLVLPGTDGPIYASVAWDPDGPGPRPELVVFGGRFQLAGPIVARNLVAYDPATGTWSGLGLGVGHLTGASEVRALAVAPTGELLVGGDFTQAGGLFFVNHIASFDGVAWSTLASGVTQPVDAIAVLPNGDVAVGGEFSLASGVIADHVARWNGSSWSAFGNGVNATVRALTALPNGDVVAGGDFTASGAVAVNRVARWNGTTWGPIGAGVNATVRALGTSGSTLLVGGDFTNAGGQAATGFATWSGTSWLGTTNTAISRVHAIAVAPTEVFVGGTGFDTSSGFNGTIASIVGTTWTHLDRTQNANALVRTLTLLPSGLLLAGGTFTDCDFPLTDNLAIGPRPWHAPGALSGFVNDLAARADGTLVVAGEFTAPGIAIEASLASFDGLQWSSHQTSIVGRARHAVTLANGNVAVHTDDLFGGTGQHLYEWNGSAWTQLPPTNLVAIDALAADANGDLLVGGYDPTAFQMVRRWDGSSWTPLPAIFLPGGLVEAMIPLPDGSIVLGSTDPGGFSQIPSVGFWRFDGVAWSQLGASLVAQSHVHALAALPNGGIAAAIDSQVLAWNGTTWAPLGANNPAGTRRLLNLPDGDLLAVGDLTFAGGSAANRIARFDGFAWSPVGTGTNATIRALAQLRGGEVVFAGDFTRAGNAPSPGLARLSTNCPANAIALGTACVGTAGPMLLRIDALPWIGGALRATATGFAASSLGLRVLGATPTAQPLTALHPLGNSTCLLLASPTDVDMLVPSAGSAAVTIAIPDTPALVGLTAYLQVLQAELGGQGQIVAVNASNAQFVTVGAF